MGIEQQIQELMQKPQSYWNAYAFSREPLGKRIAPEEQDRLADLAVCCGREEAKKMTEKFPGRTPREICQKLGIHVTYDAAENGGNPLIVAAFREPDDIRISLDALRRIGKLRNLFGWEPEEILLAHELFHYVESKKGNLPVTTERVRLKLGPLSYHGKVQILSEIAGMAFAQEFLQLTYCPFVLDRVFLYVYDMEKK